MDAEDGVSCHFCSQRALLHCPQHTMRLCLPCDVGVHADAQAHERSPLCDGCHAAPAAAHCSDHQASLCAPCARTAGCDAQRHSRRPARTYTGFPEPTELARILFFDAPPPPPPLPEPYTVVPDLVNIEQPGLPDNANVMSELLSDSLVGGNLDDHMGDQMAVSAGYDEFLLQQEWQNLNDVVLSGFDFIAHDSSLLNSANSIGPSQGALEASSSLGYDGPLIASCSEPIIPSDAVMESMNSNDAACQFSSVATTNTGSNVTANSELLPHGNFYASGMPMLPRDEFPSRHFGFEVTPPGPAPVSSSLGYQDPEAALQASSLAPAEKPSSQDMEARTKQREKRQEAKQRYKDKKKNRRFGKQIMYTSRKIRADTRNRVKGRFAKASSSGNGDDNQSTHS